MAKSSELLAALLETLHPVMPAGISYDLCISTIKEQLAEQDIASTAQQIIDNECSNQKVADASEGDLWDAFVESLCEVLQGSSARAGGIASEANSARTSFVARLKSLAAEANRRW